MANIQLSKKAIVMCLLLAFVFAMAGFNSCKKDNLASNENMTVEFQPRLSSYNIFRGDPKNMVPQPGFYLFNLATTLFTDYAEKQRLIKLPPGTRMTRVDDDLPSFPDSTIIVKTFYYYNNARDTAKGKRIIETRLLIKQQGSWNPATYV